MKKRILATILSICMIISLFPASAFAVENEQFAEESNEITLLALEDVPTLTAEGDQQLFVIGNPTRGGHVYFENTDVSQGEEIGTAIPAGTAVTLRVAPNPGYRVRGALTIRSDVDPDLTITQGTGDDADKWSFTMPGGMTVVTVNFEKIPYGVTIPEESDAGKVEMTVTAGDSDFTNPGTGKAFSGDTVTITATAKTGYELPANAVTVTPKQGTTSPVTVTPGTDGTYTFTMPADDVTVNVNFAKIHSITDKTTLGGSVVADPAQATVGTTVTLTVSRNTNYAFKSIAAICKNADGTTTPVTLVSKVAGTTYTFTMPDGDVEVTATLEGTPFQVNVVSKDNGNVTFDPALESGMIKAGTPVTITATPDPGFIVDSVSVQTLSGEPVQVSDPESVANSNAKTYTFTMPETNINVTATFVKPVLTVDYVNKPDANLTHTLTVNDSNTDNNPVAPEADGTYKVWAGDVKLTITPDTSNGTYEVLSVTAKVGEAEEQKITAADDGSFTISNVNANTTVTVTTAKRFALTVDTPSNGTLIATGDTQDGFLAGDTVTVTVNPSEGYQLQANSVKVTDTSNNDFNPPVNVTAGTTENTYTFQMPESAAKVTATFEAKTYNVTVNAKAGDVDLSNKVTVTGDKKTGSDMTVNAPAAITLENGSVYTLVDNSLSVADSKGTSVPWKQDSTNVFEMPADDVTVSATYTQAAVSVRKGSAAPDYYTSINTAVTEAQKSPNSTSNTITLLDNCTFNPALSFTATGTYTLDLNGHSLTSATNKVDGYGVSARGTDKEHKVNLTIKDSVGGGSISNCMTNVQANNYSVVTIGEQGSTNDFRIDVVRKSGDTTGSYSPLKVEELSEMKIYGGTIGAEENTGGINNRSIQSFGTTTIEGGTFKGVVQVWEWANGSTLYNSDLTINGGNFEDSVVVCTTPIKENAGEVFGGDLTINGGEFTNKNAYIGLWLPDWVEAGDLTNTGSTATNQVAPVDVKILGGNFSLVEDHIGIIQDGGIAPNPETPVFTIGQGKDEQGNTTTSPTFKARPDDSYIDTGLAASLTQTDGKFTIGDGYEVSVKGYVPEPAEGTEPAEGDPKPSNYTVTLSVTGREDVTTGSIKVPNTASVAMKIEAKTGSELNSVKIGDQVLTATNGVYTITSANAPAPAYKAEVTVDCQAKDFNITKNSAMVNGNVVASMLKPDSDPAEAEYVTVTKAHYEDDVILTVTPTPGYQLDVLTVTYEDENGTTQTMTTGANGKLIAVPNTTNKFTFKMPAADVTVNATFVEANYTLEVKQVDAEGNPVSTPSLGTVTVYVQKPNEDPKEITDFNDVDLKKGYTLSVEVTGVADGYQVQSVTGSASGGIYVAGTIVPWEDVSLSGENNVYSIPLDVTFVKSSTNEKDIIITVAYEKIPYNVTVEKTGQTDGNNVTYAITPVPESGTDKEKANIGDTVTFTVTPSVMADYDVTATLKVGTGAATPVTLTKDETNNKYTCTVKLGTDTANKEVLGDLTFSVNFAKLSNVTVNFKKDGQTGDKPSATITAGTIVNQPLDENTPYGTKIPAGTEVTITITPDASDGVKPVKITGLDGVSTLTPEKNDTNGTYSVTFTMPAKDVGLEVKYMEPDTLTLTGYKDVKNGEVTVKYEADGQQQNPSTAQDETAGTKTYTVEKGSKVIITLIADNGYELDTLTHGTAIDKSQLNATTDGTTGKTTYTYEIATYGNAVDAVKEFSVSFKGKPQEVSVKSYDTNMGTVELAGTGKTESEGKITFPTGTEVTITATPKPGFVVVDETIAVKLKGTTTDAPELSVTSNAGVVTATFKMPVDGVDVTVNFAKQRFSIKTNPYDTTKGTVKVLDAAAENANVVNNAETLTDLFVFAEPKGNYDAEVKISYDMTLDDGTPITATRKLSPVKDNPNYYKFQMPGYPITVEVTFTEKTFEDGIVASIGSVGYPTVKAAFDAAETGKETTIVLQDDSLDEQQLFVKSEITLDLNGHTLSKTHNVYTISVGQQDSDGNVSATGKLTIKDSSASTSSRARTTGTGTIANDCPTSPTTTLRVCTGSELIIESGTISNANSITGEKHTGASSAIKVENEANLTIKGGTIGYAATGNTGTGLNERSIQSYGHVTIENGTIEGSVQVFHNPETNEQASTLDITGGTFAKSVVIRGVADPALYGPSSINISGGTFTGADAMVGLYIQDSISNEDLEKTMMTITGGDFAASKVGVYKVAADGTETLEENSELLLVNGGTFANVEPDPSDVAEGKVAVKNEQGAWEIVPAVAQIVKSDETTTNYATIDQAFDAVANGDTIKLLNDTTAEDQLTVTSMTVTLDLNGHTLTKTHSKYTVSVGGDKGDLTIIDSEGTGAIANGADNTSTTLQANNGGKLTIKGGTIKNGLQPKCSAIKVEELGTLVIEGGIIKKSSMPGVNARSIQTFGNTTINGGTIEGVVQVWQWDDAKNDPDTYYPSSLTVNGGTFGDGVVICGSTSNEAKYPFGGTVIINDGIFNDNSENEDGTMVGVRIPSWFDTTTETTAHMTINGGTFNVEKKVGVYKADELVENSDYLVVDGGSFKQEPNDVADGKIAVEEDGKWVIKDQTATPHKITVTEPINGTVSVIPETATAKSTVTIVAIANEGYEIDTVTVTDTEATAVEGKTGMYTFTMPDKDVTVTVTFKAKTVEKADVAQIGETKYKTVAEAVKAANDNDKIVMLADSMETEQVTVEGKTITLDLNGHTITKQHQKYTVSVGDKGDLTIIDSEGNGVIANGADNTSTTLQANNGGKLTINGGTIKNGLQPQCSAIKVEELGELVINGGIIKKSSMPGVNARSIQTFGKSTITGGTIEGVVQVWQYNTGTTPEEAYESTLNITGGTFQDSVIICGSTKPTLDYPFGGTVNITGGTFTGVNNEDGNPMVGVRLPSKLAEEGAINNHPTMNIKGGTFDVRTGVYDVAAKDYLAEDSDYLTVTNGSFSTKPDNVPDGWEVVPDGNNGWTIKEKDPDKPEPTKYNITKTDGISGGTIETNLTEAAEGEFVAVTATPDEGYKLTELYYTTPDLVDHDVIGIAAFSMPKGDIFVSAKFEKIDYSIVIVSTEDATVTVDPADKTTATIGDTVTVKVTDVAETKTVTGITVKDTNGNAIESDGEDGTYTFTMPASHVVVTANVVDKTVDPDPVFTITAPETVEGGTITVLPGKTEIKEGTLVAVIATPADGYELSEITCTDADGKAVTVTENTFTMPASNVTVTVTFKAIEEPTEPEYAIFVVNPEGVTLTAPATAAEDDTVTVETKVSAGYTLEKVFVTKADKSTFDATPGEAGEYTFPMSDGPVVVSAVVVKDDDPAPTLYNITEGTVTGGELIFVPEQAAAEATVTVIAIPDETHTYDVTVTVTDKDGTSVTVTADESTDGKYTFTMPASDVTVSATFKAIPDDTYSVKVLNVTNGTVKVNDKSELMGLEAGAEVTVTATPTEGYELDEITVIDVSAGKTVSVTDGKFTMPAGNVVVSATFKLKATEPDDPTGKVAVEAGTPDASGNVNITISNVKSDKFYTVRVANSEGMDKESVIFVLSGKMADPDTHTLTFQVKAGNKFIMVAETAEQPILGKDNPFADEKAVVVETTISDTKAN